MAHGGAITLRELVGRRLFTVPDYQRPYAWGAKQLRDLREDIDLMGANGRHYTGTIVLARRSAFDGQVGMEEFSDWDVVDGQQRLTTLFLLISRIVRRLRTLASSSAKELADGLEADFGAVTITHARRPRLHLAGDLKDYWRWSVLEGKTTALLAETTAHRLLQDATAYFDGWLDELSEGGDESAFTVLSDLAARTADGLEMLVYETDSSTDVGVLFESLNDRGRNLTELELIKNYLLYLARLLEEPTRSELASFVNESWSRMHKNFAAAPSLTEDSVLRAHWTITQQVDKFDGARSIKAAYPRSAYIAEQTKLGGGSGQAGEDPLASLYEHIREYVSTLEQCTLFARELHDRNSHFVGFPDARSHALAVNERLRHTSYGMVRFFPVLFATRMAHPADGKFYTELLELCETYVVRIFLLTRWRTHTGRSSLRRLGRRILSEQLSTDSIRDSMLGLIRYYADDGRVQTSLEQPTNWYELAGHKFLLYEYERHLLRSEAASMKPWEIFVDNRYKETTEHILPQTPRAGSHWWDLFPDEEERKQLTHSLGNLMLTLDNSRYSNKEWVDKLGTSDASKDVPCYFNGSLEQERDVARNFTTWRPDDIRRRQDILNAWIVERWPLPSAEVGTLDREEMDEDTVTDEVDAARLADEEDQ